MTTLEWIEQELKPRSCNSEKFFYDDMESQSGFCLPIIYQEFDPAKRGHWCDRGALFDFLLATRGEGKKLLDFGPGDGWPTLIVAPFAEEIIGVDGSARRVDVCTENARRLGITNVEFLRVEAGRPLPFDSGSFDGVMAASSIEQTPDPRAALEELHRVLRPGGRIRILYEDLKRYRDGKEREIVLERIAGNTSRVVFYDRHMAEEYAEMYSLVTSLSLENLSQTLHAGQGALAFDRLTVDDLRGIVPHIVEARRCRLIHPSGRTLVSWLTEIGFSRVIPTHSGIRYAGQLFERLPQDERPGDLSGLDRLLRPLVEIVVELPAPVDLNPMITAVK